MLAEHSAYHHGEVSLQGTIINMAQDFVGRNNINLLVPGGQFGTRLKVVKIAHNLGIFILSYKILLILSIIRMICHYINIL